MTRTDSIVKKFFSGSMWLIGLALAIAVLALNHPAGELPNPKSEIRNDSETQNPDVSDFDIRASDFRVERLSVEDGLSNAFVWDILQDHQGFLWFATEDGLNRFDGYEFTIFRHQGPGTVSHNTIWALYEDQAGTLWVGTYGGGLNKFDRATQTFAHYQHDPQNPNSLSDDRVRAIHESPDEPGILWIATYGGGLNRFDTHKETFTRYRHDPNDPTSLSHDLIWSMCEDRTGALWLGTIGGLSRLNREEKEKARNSPGVKFINYQPDPKNPWSLSHSYVTSIYEDRSGALWVGTSDGGLNRFERNTETFTPFKHDPTNPQSLSHNAIRPIFEDSAGHLWIGTYGGGLNRFDRATETFIHYQNDPGDPHSLSNNIVRHIYEDRAGVLWVATWGGGLNKLVKPKFAAYRHEPNNPHSLPHNYVTAVCEDHAGSLWVGTQAGGLTRIGWDDAGSATFESFQHQDKNAQGLSDNYVTVVYEAPDEPGILWIGTFDKGLNRLDTKTKSFALYQHDSRNPDSLTSNRILSLCASPTQPGVLWIGTDDGGLNRLDRTSSTFTYVPYDNKKRDDPNHDSIRTVYESPKTKTLWVGTDGAGLYKLVGSRKSAAYDVVGYRHARDNPNSLISDRVHSIYESTDGTLWIGTFEGLSRFDPNTGRFTSYRESDGLPNNVIYGILEDQAGHLWMSTNKGLSQFNPATNRFKNYDVTDGLQSNQFYFGAVFKGRSGRMYLGGVNGLNLFHPDRIKDNPHVPPIVVTDFQIFNESVPLAAAGTKSRFSLPKHITITNEIALSYKASVFSFEFAALDYSVPEKNQYAYKMDGFDEAWTYSGSRRFATYTNLDPGDYVFRVKGSNNDGVWNEKGIAIKISITPPLWRTWWAYLSYVALALFLVFGFIKLRTRHLEQSRQALEKIVQERTQEIHKAQEQLIMQDRLASLGTLTAGIAHEIKNPLNFVTNFATLSRDLLQELREGLDKLNEQADAETTADLQEVLCLLEENIAKINEHGQRADSIVKGMLLHSRGEAGERQPADINAILDEYVGLAYHGMRGTDSTFNIKIEKEYDPSIGQVEVVRQDLSRVFLNLVNNACYATHEKKKQVGNSYSPVLSVRTKNLGDRIEIRIRDNGPGIPPHIRNKIFHPFFTTKPSGEGTGLGLAISYDIIVQEHGGEIRVESEEGSFTEFIILLPKDGKQGV
ncbi:MAG: two-component regulator propeller domain-containing protein [Acidobacteriota bacterium]|nr:two-component regulator propeller domain-containing protein [Acidobacteriota bacterium]